MAICFYVQKIIKPPDQFQLFVTCAFLSYTLSVQEGGAISLQAGATIQAVSSSPPNLPVAYNFTPLWQALLGGTYTSNTVILETPQNISVSGGSNTTIIKNGVDVGTTTTANSSDQIVIQTTAPNTVNETSTIILTIGGDEYDWLVTAAAPESLPFVPTGEMSGYTAGEFNVTPTGAATYRVPITVSPGTGGMEPQLSLAYSSQNGNGPVGMGWAMAGLSAIARCPATLAQDNFIDPVDFDDNDKFCLDGERLVAISGNYGANGTE